MATTVKKLNNDERVREACEQRILYDWSMHKQYEGGLKKGYKTGYDTAKAEDAALVEQANNRADSAEEKLRRYEAKYGKLD